MSERTAFNTFLVGKGRIKSRLDYKYAVLRGQLAFLLGAICFIYIPIDSINQVFVFIPWYLLGITIAAVILYLNRIRKYLASTLVLLIFSNLLVYFFAAVDNPSSGVFFFFTTTAAIGVLLFYPYSKIMSFVFIGVSYLLALFAFFSDWSPIPPPIQDEQTILVNFSVNFTLGLISAILVILFIIKRNKESEGSLLGNQVELEKISNKLELSQKRFQMAIEGSKAGIYEWNIPTNNVFCSPQWFNLLGYKDNEVDVNLEFFLGLVYPEDAEKTSASINAAIQNGTGYQNELRMKVKDGSYRWFQDSGLIQLVDGGPGLAVGSIIDIHDRKLAEQALSEKNSELEKTNEELDRFVYSASHDMRAPLSTLLGLVQLAEQTSDPVEHTKFFELMKKRIFTMEGFIKEVTDYSRNARLELEPVNVNLRQLCHDVVDSFQLLAEEVKINVNINVDDKLSIPTDPVRLKVILNNLVSNAIKYVDPDKEDRNVQIEASKEKFSFQIIIKDNGSGIEDKYLDKIFDMFFRASDKSDGSGLGLYIVKETVDRLGGIVSCESSNDGTTFTVRLPHSVTEPLAVSVNNPA